MSKGVASVVTTSMNNKNVVRLSTIQDDPEENNGIALITMKDGKGMKGVVTKE